MLKIYICVGHEADTAIYAVNISDTECIEIKQAILKFYQKLCDEILSRININDKTLSILSVLEPSFFLPLMKMLITLISYLNLIML